MTVLLCGLRLAHPVLNAAGTFDALAAGRAFGPGVVRAAFPFSAYVSPTLTPAPRPGGAAPRLWETASGLLSATGLPGPGLERYLAETLPHDAGLGVPLITSLAAGTAEALAELAARVGERPEVAALELRLAPAGLAAALARVRAATDLPLIVKLPAGGDLVALARAAEAAGADALALVSSPSAAAPRAGASGAPWFTDGPAGLSGPALRPLALAAVAAVADAVALPLLGMGGVERGRHAAALLDAGATAVAVGTATFLDPGAGARVVSELGGPSA